MVVFHCSTVLGEDFCSQFLLNHLWCIFFGRRFWVNKFWVNMFIFFPFLFELFKFQSRSFVVEEKNPPFPLCAQASITGGSSEDSSNLLADLWYRGQKGPGWENLVNLFRFDVSTCIHINVVQYKLRPTTDVQKKLWTPRTGVFQLDREACEGTSKFLQHQSTNKVPKLSCYPTFSPRFFFCWFKKKWPVEKPVGNCGVSQATTTNPTHRKDPPRLLGGEVTVKSCQVRLLCVDRVGWLLGQLVGWNQTSFFGASKTTLKKWPTKIQKHMLCIIHIIYFSQLIHRYIPDEMMYQCFSWLGMFYCQCFSFNWEVFFSLLFC